MIQESGAFISTDTDISLVDCRTAFTELNIKEKLYAYYFTRASWQGSKICYFQRSYESPAIFFLLQKIFQAETPEQMSAKLIGLGFSAIEIQQLFTFAGAFFESCGNYKGCGESKFIPELPKEKFWLFIQSSKAYAQLQDKFDFIWHKTNYELYAFANPYKIIEFTNNQGHTAYYSSNVTQQNAELISRFMEQESISLSPINTRLLKYSETQYEILVASISTELQPTTSYQFEGLTIKISYGDFAPFLQSLYHHLEKSIKHAENEHQIEMIKSYLKYFQNGSIEEYKKSQCHWIKDKGPIIETNIGFVESYLDPMKIRAEFQGFVSVVNKQESKKLEELVQKAESLISVLPWPKEFEVSKFTKPDFTSLDILSFPCSNIPWGINLPNYDDINQSEGFKNVNLGNAYPQPKKESILFTDEVTTDLYIKYYKVSLFVIVALHELLGHGSGKIFQRKSDGTLNFDQENLIHPIFNEKINTFYEQNETYHSKFGGISDGYEECRADAVAFFLSCFQESLDILVPEYSDNEHKDIVYVCWYQFVYQAITGLEYYDAELKKWGQAHAYAAYALNMVLIEAGILTIEKSERDRKPYMFIHLEREKIWTVGKEAIRKFLIELQVYKSTGDTIRGTEFFNRYTVVDGLMLEYRQIVLENKLPHPVSLQDDVQLIGDEEDVILQKFESTFTGMIKSFIYHYQEDVDNVYTEWLKYHQLFRINSIPNTS